ncbi:DUF5518 domain-containing protein [Natrarchaeobius sp. A-rgal3]|uniref:DUF5518 domain-containing protein n=1 Tax=Natrarchaeobius versutus TaxID=1679078 RepID=UPI00350F3839
MIALQRVVAGATDERLRTATVVGLATIPFTLLLSSWSANASTDTISIGGAISITSVLVGGLVVGYRYGERPTSGRRAGKRTGLVGSIGGILLVVVTMVTGLWGASAGYAVAVVAVSAIAIGFVVILSVFAGMIGAVIGELVATDGHAKRTSADSPETHSQGADRNGVDAGHWRYIAAYVLFTPVVFLYVFGVSPDGGAGVLLAVAMLFALVGAMIGALVALTKDIRSVGTVWQPRWRVYVGVPVGAYAVVYVVATLRNSVNPSGDGLYGFALALWLTAVMYLNYRHRYLGTP